MASPTLAPPPLTSPLSGSDGTPAPSWGRWLQQLAAVLKGASVPTGWQTPTLNAGWTSSGGHLVQYRKSATGWVALQGLAVSAANGTVFNMPVGYRPSLDLFTPVLMSTGGTTSIQYLRINANGDVSVNNVGASTSAPTTWVDIGAGWQCLDGG